jgi:hypothetical protein
MTFSPFSSCANDEDGDSKALSIDGSRRISIYFIYRQKLSIGQEEFHLDSRSNRTSPKVASSGEKLDFVGMKSPMCNKKCNKASPASSHQA